MTIEKFHVLIQKDQNKLMKILQSIKKVTNRELYMGDWSVWMDRERQN